MQQKRRLLTLAIFSRKSSDFLNELIVKKTREIDSCQFLSLWPTNFLVKLQDVTFHSTSSVILTRFFNLKPSRNRTFLTKMCSMCWFGAELSWPLRTNAEAANEGCSSFYTAALRTHTHIFVL